MARRKTGYEIRCDRLRKTGYEPESMTICEMHEVLDEKTESRSFFDVLSTENDKTGAKTVLTPPKVGKMAQ